jgi:molecular chaperone DnaK
MTNLPEDLDQQPEATEKQMKTRCGIDLGTTYSAISWYDDVAGRVDHISLDSQGGDDLMRSFIYFEPDGNIVVGEAAAHSAWRDPDRAIGGFKRSMGRDWKFALPDGDEFSAPELSAMILKRLAEDAEQFMSNPVDEVVVTVPAYFGHEEREDTKRAVEIAGLNLIELLAEPHAAALSFAVDRIEEIRDKTLLVFDLGGGTFDVALLRGTVEDRDGGMHLKADIVHKEGERSLGGLDWNNELCELVAEKMVADYGHDPRDNAVERAQLETRVEELKRRLQESSSYTILPVSPTQPVTVTAEEFEAATSHLVDRTATALQASLNWMEERRAECEEEPEPWLQPENLEVLLCGGSTRLKAIRAMVEEKMGKPPLMHGDPEKLVCTGAAYRAHIGGDSEAEVVTRKKDDEGRTVPTGLSMSSPTDVARKAVGVGVHMNPEEVLAGAEPQLASHVLLEEDSPFGEVAEETFSVAFDGQKEIPIVLYEGEGGDLAGREPLARLSITGFSDGVAKGTPVHVQLYYNDDGIIRGKAEAEGISLDIVVDPNKQKGLSTD